MSTVADVPPSFTFPYLRKAVTMAWTRKIILEEFIQIASELERKNESGRIL